MTTLLTLTKESRCVIPEDVTVLCAQLSEGALTFLVVNGKKMIDYWIYKFKKVDLYKTHFEYYRLDTFSYGNWPNYSYINTQELAKSGFYYLGTLDHVKCAFCGGILDRKSVV